MVCERGMDVNAGAGRSVANRFLSRMTKETVEFLVQERRILKRVGRGWVLIHGLCEYLQYCVLKSCMYWIGVKYLEQNGGSPMSRFCGFTKKCCVLHV